MFVCIVDPYAFITCLGGRTVNPLGCDAEVPGPFPYLYGLHYFSRAFKCNLWLAMSGSIASTIRGFHQGGDTRFWVIISVYLINIPSRGDKNSVSTRHQKFLT